MVTLPVRHSMIIQKAYRIVQFDEGAGTWNGFFFAWKKWYVEWDAVVLHTFGVKPQIIITVLALALRLETPPAPLSPALNPQSIHTLVLCTPNLHACMQYSCLCSTRSLAAGAFYLNPHKTPSETRKSRQNKTNQSNLLPSFLSERVRMEKKALIAELKAFIQLAAALVHLQITKLSATSQHTIPVLSINKNIHYAGMSLFKRKNTLALMCPQSANRAGAEGR